MNVRCLWQNGDWRRLTSTLHASTTRLGWLKRHVRGVISERRARYPARRAQCTCVPRRCNAQPRLRARLRRCLTAIRTPFRSRRSAKLRQRLMPARTCLRCRSSRHWANSNTAPRRCGSFAAATAARRSARWQTEHLTAGDAVARVDAVRILDALAHHAWRSAAHLIGRAD